MDPIVTPLLILVLGNLAKDLITDACKDYLKDKLKSFFGWLEKLGERDKVEIAYQDAMEQAFSACLEMLLQNIKGFGYADEELKHYSSSLKAFIKDRKVAEELLNAVREPGRADLPSADVLRERWKAIGGQELPSEMVWNAVVAAFRRQATKRIILSNDLRELLNAQNLQQLKELIERQGGVKVQVRRDKYSQRMRTKFSPVDLANLMPAYAEDPGRMVIQDVFVAQNVRENPPPVEIPKDVAERLGKEARYETGNGEPADLDVQQLERLRTTYVSQTPKPVLDVITSPVNRLLVLTGDPGSGKSTLMRYLLTGIIDPPVDYQTKQPLGWTLPFKNAFPLLIELRDFYALRQRGECDSFLEYVGYMGKTDQWFLDDHAVHNLLENGQSLVMFDGLDEIFDSSDRERVMNEIAGFALRYPQTRLVVTSRPVGYREQILREAGFAHFGIQELDDRQVETFINGWFALTFPQQPEQAQQRIDRVLGSVQQSRSIRLLAGNPMLLTIMALLAREEELPRERAKFYEKSVEVLCHHWDANRNLDLPEDRYLNADDKKALLRRIAMRMQAGEGGLKGNIIQEEDLVHEIQAYLTEQQWQPNAVEAKKAARRMIQQLRARNYILCLRGPMLYGFVHRTFLEYLTAAEYVRRFDRQPQQMTINELVELFDKHFGDEEWGEVLRLICGQIDEQFVGRIIEHLATRTDMDQWNRRTPLPELTVAISCLGEVRNKNRLEKSAESLLDVVLKVYHSDNSEIIRSLLASAKEIGGQWPSGNKVGRLAKNIISELSHAGRLYWPQFVAAVYPNRALIQEWVTHERSEIRWDAIEALARNWPDDATRTLLTDRALKEEDHNPRRAALEMLAEKWPDEITRSILTRCAVEDKNADVRSEALNALADNWPDEAIRMLLTDRAVADEQAQPRGVALSALAENWPDQVTRTLLSEHAVDDIDAYPRSIAFQKLADNWPDETTRSLIIEYGLEDRDNDVCNTALQALAEKWADDATRSVIAGHARINGFAASLIAGWHSEFGRIVFTEDLDGISPYLDPGTPLSRNHIMKAAEKTQIPPDELENRIRSLSAHMGWDILNGANRAKE